jgi:hypothetical protein
MAYVARRPAGRFEIRESYQSERGPRARTLANFAVLSDDVLGRAEQRALRPFDRVAVRASAIRRGARIDPALAIVAAHPAPRLRPVSRFVDASRRFARTAEAAEHRVIDNGASLVELISFAEEVARHQPRRPLEPLRFPPLAQLAASRRRAT